MIKGIYHSAAGMVPEYYRLINVSNNLANANTTAFKADRRYFRTLINNEIVQPGFQGQPRRHKDLDTGLQTQFAQGALKRTDTMTDFALNGDGFFVVEDSATGKRFYTRNGWFQMNNESELLTHKGMNVLDDTGSPIVVEGNEFVMTENGEIFSQGESRGKIMVVKFDDPTVLIKQGDGLYHNNSDIEPIPAEEARVMQGHLEESNVNIVEEMVDMISLNRSYESSTKALLAQDETLKQAVNQVSKF